MIEEIPSLVDSEEPTEEPDEVVVPMPDDT
jgi:hypothetical protein